MDEQQQPSLDPKRIATFAVAALALLYGMTFLQARLAPPPPPEPAVVDPAAAASAPVPGAPGAPAPPVPAAVPDGTDGAGAPAAAPAMQETSPRRVTVATTIARVEVSNVGGRLTSWKLLDHGEYGQRDVPVELVHRRLPPRGSEAPVPEVPGTVPADDAQDVLPLQVRTGDVALDARLASALHVVEVEERDGRHVVTASWSDGAGTSVLKRLTLADDDALAILEARVQVGGQPVPFSLLWGPGFANHVPADDSNTYLRRGEIRWRSGGKVHVADRPDDAEELPTEIVSWAAIEDSFFCAIFLPGTPEAPGSARVAQQGFRVEGALRPDAKGKTRKKDWPEEIVLAAPFTPEAPEAMLWVGPREKRALAALDARVPGDRALTSLVHLGLLDPIASVMRALLLWLHAHVHSWGWSIVLLTLIIRAALFPFTHVSLKKNRALQEKMKGIQPRLKALQERFRKQPRTTENLMRMREEQAALYSEAGVNPGEFLGGCVPMLLSFPFFLALFKLLPNAPEFRHESFLIWPDLSSGDPTHVWPILMVVTMFVSTYTGMSSAPAMDPLQRKMFLALPVVFGLFCWSAPLGLVVYWTVSNVVQIGQQQLLKYTLPTPDPVAQAKPARRDKPAPAAAALATEPAATARKKGRKR